MPSSLWNNKASNSGKVLAKSMREVAEEGNSRHDYWSSLKSMDELTNVMSKILYLFFHICFFNGKGYGWNITKFHSVSTILYRHIISYYWFILFNRFSCRAVNLNTVYDALTSTNHLLSIISDNSIAFWHATFNTLSTRQVICYIRIKYASKWFLDVKAL